MTKPRIGASEVKHIADLARIDLTPQEVKKFQKQLSDILDYIQDLKKVGTDKVEPTSQVTGLENVFRDDGIKSPLSQEEALSGSKRIKNGYFVVKKVL